MKAPRNKSDDVLHETVQDERLSEKDVSVKEMAKNLTMLDTIGLAVLIMFQPVLFQGMLIELDSQKEKAD